MQICMKAPSAKEDLLNKFVFSKKSEPELPAGIVPELAKVQIRICTAGFPEKGALYFEGTVRTFVIERLPHQTLIELLPLLLTEPRFTYQPAGEILLVERVDV